METLLLLEADAAVRERLGGALQQAGYRVVAASTARAGIALAHREAPDLALVNLRLPQLSGLAVCAILRQEHALPIIALSGSYDEQQCVASLALGANDIVSTGVSGAELVARVGALLRWHPRERPPEGRRGRHYLSASALLVDLADRRVWRGGQEVALTPMAFDLLVFLMRHHDVVFSREQLLARVWRDGPLAQPRTVDVHVHLLRTQIEDDPAQPRLIQTVRGVGYRFQASPAARQSQGPPRDPQPVRGRPVLRAS